MNRDVIVGERYKHKCGLIVRVIGQTMPGDREDELRVWCEVIGTAYAGNVEYKVGYRDGWNLLPMEGWEKIS